VVLGDLLHAKESHAPDTLAALQAWRDRHPTLQCQVVVGNHDRHAGPLHADLGFAPLPGCHRSPHWLGVHDEADLAHLHDLSEQANEPDAAQAPALVLAGHLHPVAVLAGRRDRLRLPCFWLRGGVLTLPAFGAFTGGWDVARQTPPGGDPGRCFVVAERVMEHTVPRGH
jgi:metallophosphoesterase superfamily enzyme